MIKKKIPVGTYLDKKGADKIATRQIRFLDSIRFLDGSLAFHEEYRILEYLRHEFRDKEQQRLLLSKGVFHMIGSTA